MKKICPTLCLILCICGIHIQPATACGPDYTPDTYYYNLLLQDIIDDPQYSPFLYTLSSPFYPTDAQPVRNENIEQWESYLGISYEEAWYLVFTASEESVRTLLQKKRSADPQLSFITPSFVRKHRQALEYIACAKYLEPYMSAIPLENNYGYWPYSEKPFHAGELDYEEVIARLKTGWEKSRQKELKLRYGYQLVRLAHYTHRYEESIAFFDTYVESLRFRPAMYYHALSQKAGAERGNGEVSLANYHFLQVFTHSANLKESAVRSIRLNRNMEWEDLVRHAAPTGELNDAYLLLGYFSFSNPLNEIPKILANDPNAIQAKILMMRAINQIEREDLFFYPVRYRQQKKEHFPDKRFPQMLSLTDEIINLSDRMTRDPAVQEKNFWFLVSAYLHFLHKDFAVARTFLDQVEEKNETYALQKKNLLFYIDISEPTVLTPDWETAIYEKYKDAFSGEVLEKERWGNHVLYTGTSDFVRDVLANRYYLQQEYAKSFLLTHRISELEEYPHPDLLDALEEFYRKPDKTPLEEYIASGFTVHSKSYGHPENYLDYLRGIVRLTEGDLSGAYDSFRQADPEQMKIRIPKYVFGANLIACMNCAPDTVMYTDYLGHFPFIGQEMDFRELTAILLRLEEIGAQNGLLSPEANYLLGNFFCNTSRLGYYRHLLRFNTNNGYNYKYSIYTKLDIYSDIYFKDYPTYYGNTYSQAQKYLELAYAQAKDKELKAHIVFALSKCEQEEILERNQGATYRRGVPLSPLSERKYFKELMRYRNTSYFREVESRCKYFGYYVKSNI